MPAAATRKSGGGGPTKIKNPAWSPAPGTLREFEFHECTDLRGRVKRKFRQASRGSSRERWFRRITWRNVVIAGLVPAISLMEAICLTNLIEMAGTKPGHD